MCAEPESLGVHEERYPDRASGYTPVVRWRTATTADRERAR
jgi:hypothetical protein